MVRLKNNYDPKYRRYKKEEDLYRNKIEVLFSDKQLEKLNNILQGRSISQFIRERTLKGAYFEKNKPSRSDVLTIAQLRHIGSNINQISRIYNTYRQNSDFIGHHKELQAFIEEIRSIIILLKS